MTRRAFLAIAATGAAGMLTVPRLPGRGLRVSRLKFRVPPGAEGLRAARIGFLADVHHSRFLPLALVESLAERLSREDLDLLLLGGDYADATEERPERMEDVLRVLARVRTRCGVFGVPGNHDHSLAGADPLSRAARLHGLGNLMNRGLGVRVRGSELWLAGTASYSDSSGHGIFEPERAYHGYAGQPAVLVTHNPDGLHHLPPDVPAMLALSGHLHGGQVRLPFVSRLTATRGYRTEFPWGFWGYTEANGRTAYVTRGIGAVHVPVRVFCPPEVCVFTLV